MDKEKKKRQPNISTADRSLLTDLAVKYRSILENKRTDAVTSSDKTSAWEKLAEEFNATSSSGIPRDVTQLRHAYENLKQKAKKFAAESKVAQLQTGGGPVVPVPDELSEKLLALLGNRGKPLHNCFDSDATYNYETVTGDDLQFELMDSEFCADVTGTVEPQTYSIMISHESSSSLSASAAASATMSAATTITSAAAMSTSAAAATTSAAAMSTSAAAAVSRQASTLRRQKPRSRPLRSAANQDAAEKIASVADLQSKYYAEKLAMKREQHELFLQEHAKRMRLLDLQEQLVAKKLEKIEE